MLARFTDQTKSERAWSLRERLARTVGQPDGCVEEVTASGIPWALAAHHPADGPLRVSVLRSLADRRAYSLLRQIIHTLRQRAMAAGATRIEINDDITEGTRRALHDEGFTASNGVWRADLSLQVIGCDDPIPAELGAVGAAEAPLPTSLINRIALERWPFKLFTGAPDRLHRKHTRRGVFDREQVRERATPGPDGSPEVTVLLFSQTDIFSTAISAERARELCPARSGSKASP